MHIYFAGHFKSQLKRLIKKYPHVREDLLGVLDGFSPDTAIHIGRSIYKLRIGSSDINKGKSGGLRAYIHVYRQKEILVPLCIYAKPEQTGISENELQYHFDKVIEELLNSESL